MGKIERSDDPSEARYWGRAKRRPSGGPGAQHAEQARTRVLDGSAVLFDPTADLANLVFEATVLRTFTTDLVPPLLQLPDYAHFAVQVDDPYRAALQAAVRDSWSSRLCDKDPLNVQAVFPESVLRPVVGGPRVMKAQLLHLMEMSELESVSLKIVPRGLGVLTRRVVDSADGWVAAECGVAAVVVGWVLSLVATTLVNVLA